MLTGGYVAWYGRYEIRLSTRPSGADDPVIEAAGAVQSAASGWLAGLGPWTVAATALALLVLTAGATLLRLRRAPGESSASRHPPD